MRTTLSILALLIGMVFSSCKKKNEPEPNLVGGWSDKTINVHFRADKTYGYKYLLYGSGKDTITIDSAFGEYSIDQNKKLITFNQKGYYDKKLKLVAEVVNGTTWIYQLNGNTLDYKSNTSIGSLTKIY